MAFSAKLTDRISFGNMKMRCYDLTDVASTPGSSLDTGLQNVYFIKSLNTSDSTDHFAESISTTTRGRITFIATTNLDDGKVVIIGN